MGGAALHAVQSSGVQAVDQRYQAGDAVGDGGIHHLVATARPRLQQRAHDSEGEEHRAAAEIAEQAQAYGPVGSFLQSEAMAQAVAFGAADFAEGVAAFTAKRTPVFGR